MKELSVAEQRYQAVLAVISDGLSISQVAQKVGVSRQTLHSWLARYEAEGLEGLVDRSHRPASCPHQIPADVEARLLEPRRSRQYWGPRRLVFELAKRGVSPLPSESAAYRALVRAAQRPRRRTHPRLLRQSIPPGGPFRHRDVPHKRRAIRGLIPDDHA